MEPKTTFEVTTRTMSRRSSALAIALALLGAQAVAGAADSDYRLAGIINRGGDGSVAILAVPSGGQVLIRKGSVVDGGVVTELSGRAVRIAFPDHVLELTLSGAPRSSANTARGATASATAPAATGSKSARAARQHPASLPVQTDPTRRVSREAVQAFIVNGVSQGPPSKNAKQYVDQEIAEALDLPEHSQIVSVNDRTVDSADQTVSQLQQALTNGMAAVTVNTPQGRQRLYLMAAPPTGQ